VSIRRFLLWSSASLAALMLIVAATLYWASRSETILRWGVERVATALPCSLTVQGLQGAFLEPIHVQYLACENAQFLVEARDIALVWSPWLLTSRQLNVTSLGIETLTLVSKASDSTADTPSQPRIPQDLRLPIEIDVASIRVGTLVAQSGDRVFEASAVDASYQSATDSHRLALRKLASQWGRASGEVTISNLAPFPLAAKITIATDRLEGWPVSADIELDGELQRFNADIDAMIGRLGVTTDLVLAPFEPEPLKSLTAKATGIDAARFDARLPHTALSVTIQARAAGAMSLTGRVRAENSETGKLDEQRLPVQGLDADFALDANSLRLSDLRIDLGAAGTATGMAQFAPDNVSLALEVRNLDLRAARGDLRQTGLNGSVNIDRRGDRQFVYVDLRQKDMRLEANGEVSAQRIVIERMTARAGGARLRASAMVTMDEKLGFSLDGSFVRFDPARFGDFPHADVNGTLKVLGSVRPEWVAEVKYRLAKSQLTNVPLAGSGEFKLSASRLRDADMQLDYGGNNLKLTGSFGHRSDTLMFALDAKQLDRLDANAAGNVQASGSLTGTLERPAIKADLKGRKLAFGELGIDAAQVQISVEQAEDRAVHGQARFQGISRGKVELDAVDVDVNGTLRNHSVGLSAAATGLQMAGRFDGGWDASRRVWSGVIAQLQNKGDYAFNMLRPATLELGEDIVMVGATRVEFSATEIELGETRFEDGKFSSTGSVGEVPAARLLALMDEPPAIESTLMLAGRWDIRVEDAIDGFIEIKRTDGDVVIGGEEPLTLGLNEVQLTLRAAANQVTGEAILRSAQIDAEAFAQTRLEKRGVKWGIPGTAPLSLNAKVALQSIHPLAALTSRAINADGQLSLAVKGNGTLAEPRLSGDVEGNNLKIEHVANGVFFDEGMLRASFTDDSISLTTFKLRAGEGVLSAHGRFYASNGAPVMDLEWAAEQLAVIQHPELRLTVSGAGKLGYKDETVTLNGELSANQGRVELRNRTFPTLGSDVVITGRETRSQLPAKTDRANIDLRLELGPDFTIVGRGLDARMAGEIQLASAADRALSADGEIRVASGTFDAYGRRLQIVRGEFYFAGPVNNPGINIRAMRTNQPVEAGVEVTGTARDPRVRLVSDPEVSDPDKLAWLVLGRQAESSNTQDNRALQNSAMALAAGLGTMPFQQQLARSVGLDEINFIPGNADSQGGVVAVGKQLSDRIYVTQEFGTSAAGNTLRVSYQLTRRWSVRTESGKTDSVDLFFTISFD